MIEFKFRAWDILENKMFKVDAIIFNNKKSAYTAHVLDERSGIHYLSDIWLMQYTGLKDKNGEEIYDGDIVRVQFNDGSYATGKVQCRGDKACYGVLIPKDHMWSPIFNFLEYRLSMGIEQKNNIKVIGNIHENPELLEKK